VTNECECTGTKTCGDGCLNRRPITPAPESEARGEELRLSEYHACATGDCPHMDQMDCVKAALEQIDAKDAEIEQLKARKLLAEIGIDDQLMAERDSARAWAKRWKAEAKKYRGGVSKAFDLWDKADGDRRQLRRQLRTLREAVGPLVEAVEKIADPRKRDHREPDTYTELGCVMNIADQALAAYHSALAGKENGGG
jgi:hypothetical protein